MPSDHPRPERLRAQTTDPGSRKESPKPSGKERDPVPATLTSALPQERQLTPAMALAMQRLAGNEAVTQLLQARETARPPAIEPQGTDTTDASPVVQRYQAGEPGHGGIEAEALHEAGFEGTMTEGEIGATYFGNWMRDFSQIGDAHKWWMLPVLNVLAMGEFNRQLTAEDIGGYVPSEHLDRPTKGVTRTDVGEAALPAMNKDDEASLSDAQRLWIKEEQDPTFKDMIRHRAAASHLPTYIEVGKEHSRRMFQFAATHKRGDKAVMAAIGNGLHAVEDYFSHSDFVDAAVYMLVRDHELPASSPIYRGIIARGKQLDYDPSGGIAHGARRAQIYSGSVRDEGNGAVSKLEILESEIKSGALHKAAILGALRLGWVKGGEYGEKALGAVGKVAGGVVGAPIGLVAGAGAGAGREAVKGWHQGHGIKKLWTGAKGLVGGLFHGGKSGAVEGWHTGSELGKKGLGAVGRVAGEVITPAIATACVAAVLAAVDAAIVAAKAAQKGVQAGAAVVEGTVGGVAGAGKGMAKGWSQGHGLGKVSGAVKGGASGGATGAASGAGKGWHAASNEAIQEHFINKATKADRAAKDPLPNHSQLAKDDTDHPLYGVSRSLAIVADREIGKAMIAAWNHPGNKSAVEVVVNLVDTFVCHPADNPWWKQPLKDVATGNPLKAEYILPAAAAQPAPAPGRAPRRELAGHH